VSGISLPAGLVESDRLDEPIFTPSTKAEIGTHDENISFDQMSALLGAKTARNCGVSRCKSTRARESMPHPGDRHRRHEVRIRPDRRPDNPRRRGLDP